MIYYHCLGKKNETYLDSLKIYLSEGFLSSRDQALQTKIIVPNGYWASFITRELSSTGVSSIIPQILTLRDLYDNYHISLGHSVHFRWFNRLWYMRNLLSENDSGLLMSYSELFSLIKRFDKNSDACLSLGKYTDFFQRFFEHNLYFCNKKFRELSILSFLDKLSSNVAVYFIGFDDRSFDIVNCILHNLTNIKNKIVFVLGRVPSKELIKKFDLANFDFIQYENNKVGSCYIEQCYQKIFNPHIKEDVNVFSENLSYISCDNTNQISRVVSYLLHNDMKKKVQSAIVSNNNIIVDKLSVDCRNLGISLCYKRPLVSHADAKLMLSLLDYVIHFGDKLYFSSIIENYNVRQILSSEVLAEIDKFYLHSITNKLENSKSDLSLQACAFMDDIIHFKSKSEALDKNNLLDYYILFLREYLVNQDSKVIEILCQMALSGYKITNVIEYKQLLEVIFRFTDYAVNDDKKDSITCFGFSQANLISYDKIYILDSSINFVDVNEIDSIRNIIYLLCSGIELVFINEEGAILHDVISNLKLISEDITDYWRCFDEYQFNVKRETVQYKRFEYQLSANPEVEYRPKRVTSTMISVLMQDPYLFYERYILGIDEIKEVVQSPDNKHIGTAIHSAIEYITKNKIIHQQEINKLFYGFIDDCQDEYRFIGSLWKNKIDMMSKHFYQFNLQRMAMISNVKVEEKYSFNIDNIIIDVRCDRVEELKDSLALNIIDFKMSTIPSKKSVEEFLEPQLLLQAMAVKQITDKDVCYVNYYSLLKNKTVTVAICDEMMDNFRIKMSRLLKHYLLERNEFKRFIL
ncbi:hypothetical protein GUI12_01130 [Anaplasmataceae bacterium AB001_6]|nr:hypothetical protein GUI12_01130 [Anaplasmataceae bacterium AB001_6]